MTFTEKILASKRLANRVGKVKPPFWMAIFAPKAFNRRIALCRKIVDRAETLYAEAVFESFAYSLSIVSKIAEIKRRNQPNFPSGGVHSKDGGEYIVKQN